MGFTSFLSRKPAQPQDDVSSFKAQAYGSTSESLPPVLGTNPIPGNGVNAIGSNGIRQLPRKKSRSQLPTSHSTASLRTGAASPAVSVSSAAPAPLVPRLRGASTLGRPNTAPDEPGDPSDPAFQPSSKPAGKTRNRRDSLRQSVAFLRKVGSNSELQRPDSSSTNAPPVPPIPAVHSPAPTGSGKFSRSDTASLSFSTTLSLSDSLNRGSGYVDLLDAQGELRPSNFRSRLEAAGARDYGEDVAERNIVANSGPSASSYYATSSHQSPTDSSMNLDLLAQRPRTVNYPKRVDSIDQSASVPRGSRREHRPKADHGSSRASSQDSQKYRRKSGGPSSSKHRPQPLKLQPIESNSSESAAEPPVVPRSRPTHGGFSTQQYDENHLSPRRANMRQLSQRKGGTDPVTLQVPSRPETRDFGSRYSNKRASKNRASRYNDLKGGHGDLAVESHADFDFASAAPAPNIPSAFKSFDYPEPYVLKNDGIRSKSAHDPRRGGRARSNSRPSSSSSAPGYMYPRAMSLGGMSLPGRPTLDNITEHIPPRVSSTRNWSISSLTPPHSASDWSTDVFQRPHSRHTADTSIPPSGSVKSLSLGHPKEVLYHPQPRADPQTPTYRDDHDDTNPSPAAHAGRLMDEFIKGKGKEPARKNWSPHGEFGLNNSDSDYSDPPQSKIRLESLLFRDGGYGNHGTGLPGLFDGRQSPTPSEWSVQTMTYDQALDLIAPGGLRPPNTPSTQKATFRPPFPALPSFDTSSNDGGSDATSESGLDAKLDAKLAMRVRRELKRRTRVANIEKKHGKQPMHTGNMTGDTPTSHPQYA